MLFFCGFLLSSRLAEVRALSPIPIIRKDLFTIARARGRLCGLRGGIAMGAGGKGEGGDDENQLGDVFHTEEIGNGGGSRVCILIFCIPAKLTSKNH